MQIDIAMWAKLIGAAILSWVLQFIMPIWPFLAFTVFACFADLFTGTQAARHRGEVIHSKGLRRSIKKISLYFAGILLAEGVMVVFFGGGKGLTWMTAGLIALTEVKSNFENISTVTGVDIWSQWADRIPGFFKLPPEEKK
jgi:hypothetical protein